MLSKKHAPYFLKRGIICATLGLPLLGLSIAGITFSMPIMIALAGASSIICLYAGFDIYRKAFKALFLSCTVTIDTLFTLSTLVALGVSVASFFVPMLHFEFAMALLIFACRHLGKYLEATMTKRPGPRQSFCMDLPKEANKVDGEEKDEKMVTF